MLLMGMVSAWAQDATRVYVELVGIRKLFSTKMNVNIDFGQSTSFWKNTKSLVDDDGKDINFNSMIDAMNYMSERGWMFVQAYVVPEGDKDGVGGTVHWVLCKDITSPEQITEGFMTREQYKQQHGR